MGLEMSSLLKANFVNKFFKYTALASVISMGMTLFTDASAGNRRVQSYRFVPVEQREHINQFSNYHKIFYGSELCSSPDYYCVKVHRGDTWAKLFPNPDHGELVRRLNRTNKNANSRPWILVPKDLDKNYLEYSPLPQKIEPSDRRRVIADISEHAFGAYEPDGTLKWWGPISTATKGHYTQKGKFRIYNKKGADCYSPQYRARMPYCMHYYKGFAMHAFQSVPAYNASHGCIRMFYNDAKWLNRGFVNVGSELEVRD